MYHTKPLVIIEDDDDDQFFYRTLLKKIDYSGEVIYFNNGEDAIEYLKQESSDPLLIICDINMPSINGLELRAIVVADEQLKMKATPFIFISTSSSREEIIQAKKTGGQGFFNKSTAFDNNCRTFRVIIDYWSCCLFNTV